MKQDVPKLDGLSKHERLIWNVVNTPGTAKVLINHNRKS